MSAPLETRFNLWLERDDAVVLSSWRVALLRAVRDAGSISAAAAQVDVPYRVAWQKIHEMETRLGTQLVRTQVGGHGGGGARLTATAETLIARFETLQQKVSRLLAAEADALSTFVGDLTPG